MSFIKTNLPAISIAVLGTVLLIVGIGLGGADVVFTKAVHICLECIGIG